MKKTIILVSVVLLAVLALAGCGKKPTEMPIEIPADESQPIPQEQAADEDGSFLSGTIEDLLKIGKDLQCESQYSENGYTSQAKTYISNNKFRTDAEVVVQEGQKMTTHSIIDGDWIYVWNDQSSNGTKMKLEEVKNQQQPAETEGDPATAQSANINQKVDFDCSSWDVDESLLTPPSEINFSDISQQMQQLPGQAPTAPENPCQVCDLIPDETAKSECKKNCQ